MRDTEESTVRRKVTERGQQQPWKRTKAAATTNARSSSDQLALTAQPSVQARKRSGPRTAPGRPSFLLVFSRFDDRAPAAPASCCLREDTPSASPPQSARQTACRPRAPRPRSAPWTRPAGCGGARERRSVFVRPESHSSEGREQCQSYPAARALNRSTHEGRVFRKPSRTRERERRAPRPPADGPRLWSAPARAPCPAAVRAKDRLQVARSEEAKG